MWIFLVSVAGIGWAGLIAYALGLSGVGHQQD